MKVGFTGTRRGMTDLQTEEVNDWLRRYAGALHHGDCVGADEQAHALGLGWLWIVVHPPLNEKYRAFVKGGDEYRDPAPYLIRNHAIVDETEVLIATPKEPTEVLRSGTWATIRYARAQGKDVKIFLP